MAVFKQMLKIGRMQKLKAYDALLLERRDDGFKTNVKKLVRCNYEGIQRKEDLKKKCYPEKYESYLYYSVRKTLPNTRRI